MDRRLLYVIDIIGVVGALAFLALYFTNIEPLSAYVVSIIVLLLLYLNIRQAAVEFIDYNMLMDVIPIDVIRDDRLRVIKFLVVVIALAAGIAICGFSYLMLPTEQLVWAVTFTAYVLLAACLLNTFIGINYLVINEIPMKNLTMAASGIIAILLWALGWFMLPRGQFMYALMAGIIIFLLAALYKNGHIALLIVKKLNSRQANERLDLYYKIFNFVALAALLAIILGVRFLLPQLSILLVLSGPIFILFLAVNVWKIISDISPNTRFNTGHR